MSDFKEELQKALSYILEYMHGDNLSGKFESTAEVVAEFNRKIEQKKSSENKPLE